MSKSSKDQTSTVEKNSTNTNILQDNEIKDQFSGVLSSLSAFRQQITMLQNEIRGL